MNEYRIDLPYLTPPRSMNDRLHRQVEAKIDKQIRAFTSVAGSFVPALAHAYVELHYAPKDARRRDEDNLVATLKPACDGLVDGGVVPDDTPDLMTKHMPIIDPPDRDPNRTSRLYLIVRGVPA